MDAGLRIDEEAFQREMESQREKSRGNIGSINIIMPMPTIEAYGIVGETEFVGYDTLRIDAIVIDIFKDGKPVDDLEEGEEGEIILDRTPFYGESGGQVGDTGTIESEDSYIKVLDTKKPLS